MNCGEMQKSDGQQQAEMMQAMQQQQQQQQAQSVVTTSGCVVNQAPQMQPAFQTLQIQQPPQSSTPMPSPSPVAMQMMPPQQPQQMQHFATTEWQGQRIQLVQQPQGQIQYMQQVYNTQNGQQFLIPANIHHPGQPLQVITTGKTFQPGPMTPQLITSQQGKTTMVQAAHAQQAGATQCYIPAQQANATPGQQQTLLISHVAGGQQGTATAVMQQSSPGPKQPEPQKAKVIQAQQPKSIQQQPTGMIVQQQPQQILTQATGVLPNQQIITNPVQWQSFQNQGAVWAQPASNMQMSTGTINATSSPIFIRSTQPDGTHVYIQSNAMQQPMQQAQVSAAPQLVQQQQQQQLKPALVKVSEATTTANIQPKVVAAQPTVTTPKTLTIRPSAGQQLIQPASTVSTQTSVSTAAAAKPVPKLKLKPARPPVTPKPPQADAAKQQQQQVTTTTSSQQIIVNKVLLPNNQPMQVMQVEASKQLQTAGPMQVTKLVPVTQPIQLVPAPPKEKPPTVLAPVVPLQPLAPLLQVAQPQSEPPRLTPPLAPEPKEVEERAFSSPEFPEEEEALEAAISAAVDERSGEKLKALVKPQVLTHVIEGFIIQEAGEPFQINNEPKATCEFCKKTDLRSKFKKSKRYCSSSCAKSHKRQKEEQLGGKRPRTATSDSSGEELVIDEETTNSSAQAESTPSPPPTEPTPSNGTSPGPQEWGVKEVCDFVKALPGCAEYVEDFSMQEIDGQALLLLRADHLMSAMGMKLGPALKICAKIQQLKSGIVDTS